MQTCQKCHHELINNVVGFPVYGSPLFLDNQVVPLIFSVYDANDADEEDEID